MHVINNNNLGNANQKNLSMGGNTQPFNQKHVQQSSQGHKSYYGQQPKTSTSTKGRAQSHGQNLITSGNQQ